MIARGPALLQRALLVVVATAGCASTDGGAVKRGARHLGRAVARGDRDHLVDRVVPGVMPTVDAAQLLGRERRSWGRRIARPSEVVPEAWVLLAPDHAVRVRWTKHGWRFAEDPTDLYARETPAAALRALVLASRHQRWDVLVELAPRRYRLGLSAEDLRAAWTDGEQGAALRAARDRLAEHLADPIVADEHEARLDLGKGRAARLEREPDGWVVVEF